MADISLVSRVRTRRKKKKPRQEQQEDNSKGDICYLENICGAGQTYTIEDELNIDGLMEETCFSYVFKLGIILNE